MPGDEPLFEALQGGQKPNFDEKMKRRKSQTRQNPSTEALNRPRVFPIIDMATITSGLAGCRAGRGHRKMLTFHNISQHFREIDASLRRIPGNTELDPLRDRSEATKSHHPMAWPERLTIYLRHAPAANVTTPCRGFQSDRRLVTCPCNFLIAQVLTCV
jgi:hypothetical protein